MIDASNQWDSGSTPDEGNVITVHVRGPLVRLFGGWRFGLSVALTGVGLSLIMRFVFEVAIAAVPLSLVAFVAVALIAARRAQERAAAFSRQLSRPDLAAQLMLARCGGVFTAETFRAFARTRVAMGDRNVTVMLTPDPEKELRPVQYAFEPRLLRECVAVSDKDVRDPDAVMSGPPDVQARIRRNVRFTGGWGWVLFSLIGFLPLIWLGIRERQPLAIGLGLALVAFGLSAAMFGLDWLYGKEWLVVPGGIIRRTRHGARWKLR